METWTRIAIGISIVAVLIMMAAFIMSDPDKQ